MTTYPLPGTSVTHESTVERIAESVAALPPEGRELIYAMGGWEWSLHWYLSQWGGMTATVSGWCHGSMLVVAWRAPHEGDDLLLVTCIFKANDETKFQTVTLEDMTKLGGLVSTA
jgi:hypothetical protein